MMHGGTLARLLFLVSLLSFGGTLRAGASTVTSGRYSLEGFVEVNGVRLQYLDWGGSGPALILIHGLGDNPHTFDDLAPAFTDRFHVIAYARRGCGGSEVKGPYDVATLTNDLRGLMAALGIAKADLVGYSAGGAEITEFAEEYPNHVDRIVYLDDYDFTDPEYEPVQKAIPFNGFDPPAVSMSSLDAFRAFQKNTWFATLDDMGRVEALIRDQVVIQPDGSLTHRMSRDLTGAIFTALATGKRRDYGRVRCPVLAIYSEHGINVYASDFQSRNAAIAYEKKYWIPYRTRVINKMRRDLANLEIVRVPGMHTDFLYVSRQDIVNRVQRFLGEAAR